MQCGFLPLQAFQPSGALLVSSIIQEKGNEKF